MSIAELLPVVISVSIFIIVFSIGLDATFRDAISLFRRPWLLVKSVFSMQIVMVFLAVAAAYFFNLDPPIRIALVALAISPVPPILPKKQQKAGGTGSYSVGLLVAAALFAVVLVPGWVEFIGSVFDRDVHVAPSRVATVVLISTLVPLFSGMLVHRFAPALAERLIKPALLIGFVLLVIAVLPVLFIASKVVWAMIGNGVIAVVTAFSLVGIAIGHILGGPGPDDRTVLALATSTRHPGIAMLVATANFPDQKNEVLAVLLIYLIVASIIAIPYMRWRKSRHPELAEGVRP